MLTRHIRESLQVTPGPFPDFWVGPGDEASSAVWADDGPKVVSLETDFHIKSGRESGDTV